ncbi:acyl-CoA dehydrogenase [Cupriavidus sp. IDO]|uniref:acyl-CoA dehydrogenase n=1 Tax=Cupriavidus sp. IDO TaxID=1539142 RepID=UPI0005796435|nr:acyl-CoA dehydrogenase [Cupriavidus sp. IDO]KWR87832.1 hypothetical protein RM96_22825 [Cupriavidus sp. IDO]
MRSFVAPLGEIRFILRELLDVDRELSGLPAYRGLGADTCEQVIGAAARYAEDVVAPLNARGDREGCVLEAGEVRTPHGYAAAYRAFVEQGWPALACRAEDGGQALPSLLNNVLYEFLNATCPAWSMYPALAHGAYHTLRHYGSEALRRLYLPKLVSGEWTATMCLTEPQSGSDLGTVRCRAEAEGHGAWRLSGAKLFISGGDHDLAENIVHLVLARLPGAPAGSRGVSLFVVPKFIPDAVGRPGVRNAVRVTGIEHKMGICGSATCAMQFDGAVGWLVGAPHCGLSNAFVMMNAARLGVGVQAVGIAEAASQAAIDYARQRRQGRAANIATEAAPIIAHAEVRRMLLTQKAWVEGGRMLAYWLGLQLDVEAHHEDPHARQRAEDLVALLTPVAKAFLTDNASACANLAIQVHGGYGYMVETGVEQLVRDARIMQIYEGSNGIQAIDLLGRKVIADDGRRLRVFLDLIAVWLASPGAQTAPASMRQRLGSLAADVEVLSRELSACVASDPHLVGAVATDYLRIIGHLAFAYLFARSAATCAARAVAGDPFFQARHAVAAFYFNRLLPEADACLAAIRACDGDFAVRDDAILFF